MLEGRTRKDNESTTNRWWTHKLENAWLSSCGYGNECDWLINYSWCTCTAHAHPPLTIVKSLTLDFTDIKYNENIKKCTLWKDDIQQNTMVLLVVLFVVLLTCFLNNLITFQIANTSLFNTSPDGSLTILTVTMLANVPSSDTALQPHLKCVNYIQRLWI